MGTGPTAKKSGSRSKKKQYKRAVWLCNRKKDVDQIQDEMKAMQDKQPTIPYDDELPGGGQFYCVETARHFVDAKALADHKKTKEYKRRLKQLKEEQYTQEVAEAAAGMTKEVLPPAHAKK